MSIHESMVSDGMAYDDLEFCANARRRTNSVTSPWEFACNWYQVDEIASNIANRHRFGADQRPIPEDVNSREFAEWLAHEYRLAMNKGIEIGRQWSQSAVGVSR